MIEFDESTRAEPGFLLDEHEMLTGWLDYHRATLLMKCAGLTDDQLRARSCEPSTLSLLGLLRHMTEVEHGWFAEWDDRRQPPRYYTKERPDDDFDDLDAVEVDEVVAVFLAECELSRATAATRKLGDTFASRRGETISLRWVVTHMIEEYARHNGHADLLRQRIDGATGV